MPYYDTEPAIATMDITTGDYVFSHQDGRYWTYKKHKPSTTLKKIEKYRDLEIKVPSQSSDSKS